jgi:hypothetical protein
LVWPPVSQSLCRLIGLALLWFWQVGSPTVWMALLPAQPRKPIAVATWISCVTTPFTLLVPLGFAIADPAANAVAACAMLFSFYVNGGSFLGYAILAEKHGLSTDRRGSKSLYFTGGLAEGTETIAVFVIACLAPIWFPWLAYGFTVLVMLTAIARILMAWQTFRP